LILGMANGALVVSEPLGDGAPYVAGRHYVEATADQMPAVIRHYLARPDERRRIAEEGRRFVTTELTMARSVDRILALAAGGARAAASPA
jgi:hypothetical protein